MPLVFLAVLLGAALFGSMVPYEVKSTLYAVSLLIKEILITLMPLIIFSLVFNAVVRLGYGALKYAILVTVLVCCSNFVNTMISYVLSCFTVGVDLCSQVQVPTASGGQLAPAFEIAASPKLVSNAGALAAGIVCGLCLGITKGPKMAQLTRQTMVALETVAKWVFKIIIPLIPLFIAGTALKLQHDGVLKSICEQYFPVLCIFVTSACSYVLLQFFAMSGFRMAIAAQFIKNTLPAMVTAFGSASSAAALPLSIKAAEKNLQEKANAGAIVPAVVNIHLVGDCFFLPLSAIAVMMSFGMEFPSIFQYMIFAAHFVLAKFAVAAVPGGGVLVMIPVMQSYLGLSSDMLALVTAIYMLFDPLITTCNVAGNSCFAIGSEKLMMFMAGSSKR
jgi:Na+/H+-dicarboxylate symporter